jgi:hypothetical protein
MKYPRAVFAAAAIALGVAVTLTPPDGPQGCCTRAHAQTASPEAKTEPTREPSTAPSTWDHNGSVMVLLESGASREFHYQTPRPGMMEAGARSGSLLFRGRLDNGQYSGTAYIFNPRCGPIPFQVTGTALDNDERIVLTGQAPLVGRNCRTSGSFTSTLEFKRLNPTAATAPQQQLEGAMPAPSVEPPRSETPSAAQADTAPKKLTASKATPDTATAQLPATNASPAATKGVDHYLLGILIIAVILVIGAAAMLAAS